jgi:predicted nucleic acid-binding protein
VIIVDTSVWVDHFRRSNNLLVALLDDNAAMVHPFVLGELLLGGLPGEGEAAAALRTIQQAPVAGTEEVAMFISQAVLAGTGVGYVDCHLLVSALLLGTGRILTEDKRLREQAERLGVAYAP